jgi:hypothetical protein
MCESRFGRRCRRRAGRYILCAGWCYRVQVAWLPYAASGAFGGLAVVAVQVLGVLDKTPSSPHWLGGRKPYYLAISSLIRIGLGAGTAVIMASTGQINGAFGAFWVGLSAPLFIDQLAKRSPVAPIDTRSPSDSVEHAPSVEDSSDTSRLTQENERREPAHFATTDSSYAFSSETRLEASVREILPGVWEAMERTIPTATPITEAPSTQLEPPLNFSPTPFAVPFHSIMDNRPEGSDRSRQKKPGS